MSLGLSLSDDEVVLVKTQKAPVQCQSKPKEAPPQRDLITDKAERRHAKSCDRTACPRCLVASKPKWLERDTHISNGLDASVLANLSGHHLALANASWCQARCSPSGDDWGLGCIACANLPPTRTIGTMARVWAQYEACQNSLANWQLQRHARSQVHQQAVLHLLGVAVGPTGGCLSGAPTLDSFRTLLSRMEEGESERASARRQSGAKCSLKIRNMRWAVVEALREKDREFLRTSTTIVLMRDERETRLLVRYCAADKHLNVRRGFLGQTRGAGGLGREIVAATGRVLRTFCTRKAGLPPGGRGAPTRDQGLLRHIQDRIEILVSDSAASELLAANIGRGKRADDGVEGPRDPLTPNLVLVGRDYAHSFRRTLSSGSLK
jgi:hypothetical protein